MALLQNVWYYMDQYWYDIADPRVDHLWLVNGGIWQILSIMSLYLILTRIVLPKHMKHRKAYSLKNVILFYNSCMVCLNLYLFYWFIVYIDNLYQRLQDFNYPSREDWSPQTMHILKLGWHGYLIRVLDLMDTVFFVLRKKESQVTTLHLYHHTIVPIIGWVSFKYNAMIGIIGLFGFINTFIHVMMYSYYALSSLGPSVQKYLWWKRYITVCQIWQFVICGTYGLILYCKQTNYPMEWFALCVGQNPIFFYMFYDFYRKSYYKKQTKVK